MRNRHTYLVVLLLLLCAAGSVLAGGGPQNVLVVVNSASSESLEIGNAYRRARNIPYRQVFMLKTSTAFAVPYQTYLDEIETPIQNYLKTQQLEDEVTCIVLTRGIPMQVLVENGRSTASLLATMNMKKEGKAVYARCTNPYSNMPVAFSHRPDVLKGMYLVTALNGYHVQDIERMISQGAAADGSAPDGRYLFQTSPNLSKSLYAKVTDLLAVRSLDADVVNAPPPLNKGNGLMGYFSGGIFSGLTKEAITSCAFRPGAIADLAQNSSAAANNFDESIPAILLPVSWFVRAGVSGVHGVVGEAGLNTMPLVANAPALLDHYTSGFSLAESFFAALPALNWQNIILGDPLCSPYAQRPVVTIDQGMDQLLKDIAPLRITASAKVRGATISRVEVYLDDRFMQTLYEPESTQIVLRAGEHHLVYTVPRGATLRILLEGLANAINNEAEFNGPEGVKAVLSLNTGTLQLLARTPGEAGNDTPVSISVTGEKQNAPVVTARMDHPQLSGGGVAPTPARATINFVGRRLKPGDEVTLQIQKEKLTYTVPEDNATVADLLDALVKQVETSPALSTTKGVHAYRDANGMPFITLEARTPGEQGNAIPFQLTVKATEGSQLRGYPDTPSFLNGGHAGSAASLDIHFALGESMLHATYLLKTTEFADGCHRLRVVAYDGSPAQVQGSSELVLNIQNSPAPPVVTLPDKIGPIGMEAIASISALPNVKRVDLFVDGQLLGSGNAAPFTIRVPLTNLGRGVHDLWAEGFDAEGNSYVTAPIPLTVLTPPEVARVTPDHTSQAGGSIHRIIGAGFQPDCTVQLAGVPVRAVSYLSPNMLEVVSDAGPARQGSVEVTNPDHTVSALTTRFEYYIPHVARIQIIPDQDVLAPGTKTTFSTACTDQYSHPIQATVSWESTGGTITTTGQYTAPDKPGKYIISANHPDCKLPTEIPVTVGPADVHDGHLRQWLLAGPIPDADHTGLEAATLDESKLAPSHGEQVGQLAWQSIASAKDYVDLGSILAPNANVIAYAHVYLYAPEVTPCTLVFGSDDGVRIWLNGNVLCTLHVRRVADPNQNTQAMTLQQGWNRLLMKVDQESGEWGFYMRLQTMDGKPLTGIQFALDKPADVK